MLKKCVYLDLCIVLSMVKLGQIYISEKDGYLSQFSGSYELEVPFKSDKVSTATVVSIGN